MWAQAVNSDMGSSTNLTLMILKQPLIIGNVTILTTIMFQFRNTERNLSICYPLGTFWSWKIESRVEYTNCISSRASLSSVW